jgi:hypothetical protein
MERTEIYEKYYQLWKEGLLDSEIFEQLGLSKNKYKELQPYFFNYVREKMKLENIKGVFKLKKTAKLEEKFLNLIQSGLPYDKAAKIMNIPLATLMNEWFMDPYFKAQVDYAVEITNSKVIAALYKRAVGETRICRSRTTSRTRPKVKKAGDSENFEDYTPLDDDGMLTMVTDTEREEYLPPSVEAQKFWLVNQDPERWSLTGDIKKVGNKGKILEAIDHMTEYSDEDKEELGIE